MRDLIEIRLIWVAVLTVLASIGGSYILSWLYLQWFILLLLVTPLQGITIVGLLTLAGFGVILAGLDLAFGELDTIRFAGWFLIGAAYLLMYEYIALYEVGYLLRGYKVNGHIVALVNFGFRFIPVVFQSVRDAYIGYIAKFGLRQPRKKIVQQLALPIIVMTLHKFEQMWISYNLKFDQETGFFIRITWKDWLFGSLTIINFIILVKTISTAI